MPTSDLTYQTRPATVGEPPYPGLILLHGLGSNELDLMTLGQGIDRRFFVISVRAPHAYTWGGYMWFDVEKEGPGLGGPGITRSLDELRGLLSDVVEKDPIDPKTLYVGGFSQGAAMAGAMGLLYPEQVAGAVMISGFIPPETAAQYPRGGAAGHPYFQAHGTQDPVVSIQYARMTRDFLEEAGVELTYREYPVGHTASPAMLLDLTAWLQTVL